MTKMTWLEKIISRLFLTPTFLNTKEIPESLINNIPLWRDTFFPAGH